MTDGERAACRGRSLQLCPADKPIFGMSVNTCILSLYLQSEAIRKDCDRTLIIGHPAPTSERHGQIVLYHFPESRQVILKCWQHQSWKTTSLVLHGAGTLSNTEKCHLTSEGIQLYPGLSGKSEFTVHAPELYTPSLPPVTSHEEFEQLKKMYATLGTETEHQSSVDFSRKNELDLSTLVGPRSSRIQPSREPYWLIPTLISSGMTMLLCALCYTLRKHLRRIPKICCSETTPESKVPSTNSHASPQVQQTLESCSEQSSQDVYFTTYTTPQK
jgi:hypothetical protein